MPGSEPTAPKPGAPSAPKIEPAPWKSSDRPYASKPSPPPSAPKPAPSEPRPITSKPEPNSAGEKSELSPPQHSSPRLVAGSQNPPSPALAPLVAPLPDVLVRLDMALIGTTPPTFPVTSTIFRALPDFAGAWGTEEINCADAACTLATSRAGLGLPRGPTARRSGWSFAAAR